MNKMWKVARWEYIEKVKTKTFILTLILTPMIWAVFGVLPSLLAIKTEKQKTIGVVDLTGSLQDDFLQKMTEKFKLSDGRPTYTMIPLQPTFADLNNVKAEFDKELLGKSKTMDGYLIIPGDILKSGKCEFRGENVGDTKTLERLERTLNDVTVAKKITAAGVNKSLIEDLQKRVELESRKITEKGEENKGFLEVFAGAYIFILMMFIIIQLTGQMLVRSVLEEKSNRIVEVLISSISSTDLMGGKIIGLGALGLTQVAVWSMLGLGAMMLTKGQVNLFDLKDIGFFAIYFILGYLFYASMFVSLGAVTNTEQEAQTITGYGSLVLILPMVFAFVVLQDPNSSLSRILSFIPIFTPTMMVMRIPVQMPSTFDLIGSMLILAGSTYLGIKAAGKIFRIAILMYGKRPTLPEIFRWVRVK